MSNKEIGLTSGYKKYLNSLQLNCHKLEYGDSSNDDLSSEWESGDDNKPKVFKFASNLLLKVFKKIQILIDLFCSFHHI